MFTPAPDAPAQAVWRGFKMKCPSCGRGRLFGRFLKVADHCADCGEVFSHHRADDFPPYVVMMIVGHAVVPAVLALELSYAPAIWLQFLIWLPVTLLSALLLLQPVKGAIVGMQWQLGMHGFASSKGRRLATAHALPPIETVVTKT
ncbi:MAG TPA: DUF983 domain-containing protein [Vineibacter sp.]|nr:DUF983 domain-containing protein [Vineibacter sp.]